MNKITPKEAVILAGGLGTRLRSAVNDRPKILAAIRERPFIFYIMDQLALIGISRVILCTNYMHEMVQSAVGPRFGSMDIDYSREDTPLGTGGALRLALPLLADDSVIVMNGDSYCSVDLVKLFSHHKKQPQIKLSIVVSYVANVGRYGKVSFDDLGRIISFEEKGLYSGAGYINAGIYVIDKDVIMNIPSARPISLEREIFPSLIGKGLYGFTTQETFIDIGIPSDYFQAQHFFENDIA